MHSESYPKILIVDDEPNNHWVYQRILEILPLHIVTAMSGQKALELAYAHDYFLILMDVQMPNMDGFEAASLILDHPKTSHIPIIFITAFAKEQLFEFKGYSSGAVDYLTKPINDDILRSKVKVFLELYSQRKRLEDEIEERKRLELEREQLARHLRQSSKMEALGTLAGGIAHNFNNILMGVIGNLELSLLTMDPAFPQRDFIDKAFSAARRAAKLSTMMLQFVGQTDAEMEQLEIGALLHEMIEILRSQIQPGIEMRDLGGQRACFRGDPGMMRQVIVTLMMNCAEAMGVEQGAITVSYGEKQYGADDLFTFTMNETLDPGSYVYLRIEDSGPGMESVVAERAFEPFFTTKETGRGMGLATLLGIVRAHQGAVSLASKVGKGTMVTLLFPALTGEECSCDHSSGTVLQMGEGLHGTVLLADDEPMLREVVRELLQQMGLQVIVAEDGEEALKLYSKDALSIDLILLDLAMPGLDGCDVLAGIRKQSQTPVILITESPVEQVTAMDPVLWEKVSILQKPFGLQELSDIVSEMVLGG